MINWTAVLRLFGRGAIPGAIVGGTCLIWLVWWAALLISVPSALFLGLFIPNRNAISEGQKQDALMASHEENLYEVKEDMSDEFY